VDRFAYLLEGSAATDMVIASSISLSVGFGFSLSSADTAMIMPDWQ
jgi:hypothetical protein